MQNEVERIERPDRLERAKQAGAGFSFIEVLVTLLLPVTAVVLGIAFLDETLRVQDLVGMIIIGFGLVVLDGRLVLAIRARISSAK